MAHEIQITKTGSPDVLQLREAVHGSQERLRWLNDFCGYLVAPVIGIFNRRPLRA